MRNTYMAHPLGTGALTAREAIVSLSLSGLPTLDLMSEAATAALVDAGLERRDIDGLICGYSTLLPHLMLATVFAEHFGLAPAYAHGVQVGLNPDSAGIPPHPVGVVRARAAELLGRDEAAVERAAPIADVEVVLVQAPRRRTSRGVPGERSRPRSSARRTRHRGPRFCSRVAHLLHESFEGFVVVGEKGEPAQA